MLPLLAVLEPTALKHFPKLVVLARKAGRNTFDPQGAPIDPAQIAAPGRNEEVRALELAQELAGVDRDNISAFSAAQQWTREMFLRKLYQAFRPMAKRHQEAFDTRVEQEKYLVPARATAARGFKLVVYGHTHHAKRVELPNGARYLNTGTWADLMRLPRTVLDGDEATGWEQFTRFVEDLEHNRLGAWRKQIPTFAQVDLSADGNCAGDVFLFRSGPDRAEPLPQGTLWEEWERND